ncbi:MAG: hypothetical protein KGK13_12310, partial [Rhodospirillales bacterium]|nr:hypothetical protein [Rhodospirillales bacterium]
ELNEIQGALVEAALDGGGDPAALRFALGRPAESAIALAHDVALMPDLAALIVAVRGLRRLRG